MGDAIQIGAGLKVSDPAVGVVGLVALGAIGAHLVTSILSGPKRRALTVAHKTSTPSIHEAMFGEIQAMATDPGIVNRNADRVNEALKQRRDYIKTLREKVNSGLITQQQFVEGIQQHASDVMDQLEIPQGPHPASHHPDHMKLWKNFRASQLQQDLATPGGLILDPEERAFVEHQQMAYPAQVDQTNELALREATKKQMEAQRLEVLRRNLRNEQDFRRAVIQRDAAQDAFVRGINERKRAGVSQ